ncbi:MAG TPA: mannose-1-phosphate guanylyltransferase [Mycobacteriales bacterium]|nr:mannose-1-phosphate guanylyltransferase [Mycobacteriales bacterium]
MFFAVIPAGGTGTRLWPVSRADRPKFLESLVDPDRSMLQSTVQRVSRLTDSAHTLIVTGAAHAVAVARQLPGISEQNILVEPSPRDSCAAIALAAAVIARRDPDATMGSFAADHVIDDQKRFAEVVTDAIAGAEAGHLMTIGITPTHPETGYGYVQCGARTGLGPVLTVEKFREKPPAEVAREYVDSGKFLWNASMFVWRVDRFLTALARYRPDIHAPIMEIAAVWDEPVRGQILEELWATIPRIAVEYAVMEPAAADHDVATVPGDFGWTDVGDFRALGGLVPPDVTGSMVVAASRPSAPQVVTDRSERLIVVPRGNRLITAIGVHDLVVVDTPDALLISDIDAVQDVKKIVATLSNSGYDAYV